MKIMLRKRVTYDREVLYNQVWEEPIVKVAEKYGVSDPRFGMGVCYNAYSRR